MTYTQRSGSSRRAFLKTCLLTPLIKNIDLRPWGNIHTVKGTIAPRLLGQTLIHEHILVDFIGADKISSDRWKHENVITKVLPFLAEIKDRGIKTLIDCTPDFLGRDVALLKKVSEQSGIQILTNSGYYGASDNKYLPAHAFQESAEQLAARWIKEATHGIEQTGIKPGFIKIGVNPGPLSPLHRKLVMAAAMTHLETGLTICSHTGPPVPAYEQLDVLQSLGVAAQAFVWVHANGSAEDLVRIAGKGAWISLDGINADNLEKNTANVLMLKKEGFLNRVLISQDAGWYKPGEPDGGNFRGYTVLTDQFLPVLELHGLTKSDISRLLVDNPAKAFEIRVRR